MPAKSQLCCLIWVLEAVRYGYTETEQYIDTLWNHKTNKTKKSVTQNYLNLYLSLYSLGISKSKGSFSLSFHHTDHNGTQRTVNLQHLISAQIPTLLSTVNYLMFCGEGCALVGVQASHLWGPASALLGQRAQTPPGRLQHNLMGYLLGAYLRPVPFPALIWPSYRESLVNGLMTLKSSGWNEFMTEEVTG